MSYVEYVVLFKGTRITCGILLVALYVLFNDVKQSLQLTGIGNVKTMHQFSDDSAAYGNSLFIDLSSLVCEHNVIDSLIGFTPLCGNQLVFFHTINQGSDIVLLRICPTGKVGVFRRTTADCESLENHVLYQ